MTELTGLCREHSFERSEDICNRCGAEYCELCLVYPFGPKKALCKECAMVAGGVRAHTPRPEMNKRDLKRRIKAFRARAGKSTGASGAAEDMDPVLSDPLAPTAEDLERLPVTVPADDGADVARELSDAFSQAPPPPPPPAPSAPADGVAPPIDWSQPFG